MIVSGLLYILSGLIDLFSFLLPSWHLPQSMIDSYAYFYNHIIVWSNYFPIEATINCVGIILSFHLIQMIVRLAGGFLSVVRGGGQVDV